MSTKEPNLIMDVGQRTYTVVDNWLFDAPLSVYEKITFIALKKYAWSQSRCFPSLATLAKDTSTSPDTVSRAIKGLVSRGLVRCVSGKEKGLANVYFLGPFDGEVNVIIQQAMERSKCLPPLCRSEPTADSGTPPAAASGTPVADSGRGAAESGTKITHQKDSIKKNLSEREKSLILMTWKKTFGDAPPDPGKGTFEKMDYMLSLFREGKIEPRAPLAYLRKMTAPPDGFESIVDAEEKAKERRAVEEAEAAADRKRMEEAAEKNALAAEAWQSLSEDEKARHGSFLRFRAQWSVQGVRLG